MPVAPQKRWKITPPQAPERLAALGVPRLLAQVLYNRGVRSAAEAQAYLDGDTAALHNPHLLPGMDAAVHRILAALRSGHPIAVFGDFDVDGISGTALLAQTIADLGGHPIPYIPHRLEGHGLSLPALESLAAQGARLVVTVDTGVTAVEEARQARAWGLDVVITDHHTPAETLPAASAVVTPRVPGSAYPFPYLAGAGLALKLAQALYQAMERPLPPWTFELACLGTVADLAPLTGENHLIVRRGLEHLNRTQRLGLLELYQCAGLRPGQVDTDALGYAVVPRLNAAGRLAHAQASLRLLLTHDVAEARTLAAELEASNRQRQALTDAALERARQMLPTPLPPLLLVAHEEFNPGVVGLVAGRLAEECYRPAVACALAADEARGSARSIPEFNVIEALRACAHLFQRFGGHPQAAGFLMDRRRLDELRDALTAIAATALRGVDLQPTLAIDAEVDLARTQVRDLLALRDLEPFGVGNPRPVLLARRLRLLAARPVGAQGSHLRLKLHDGRAAWDATAFRQSDRSPGDGPLDVAFTVTVERWNGQGVLALRVLDFRTTP